MLGGKRGEAFYGGNGYSGGGAGPDYYKNYGGSGGTNGGNGEEVVDSNGHITKGGIGSGFNISDPQKNFNRYIIKAAPGNWRGKGIGGGGGGIIIDEVSSNFKEEMKRARADTVRYGQGGDGKYGEMPEGGVVLFELEFNVIN